MRRDMPKVLVERPRGGAGKLKKRRPVRDGDCEPTRIGLARDARERGGRKWLDENLAPLRRYLEAQVGRPWNKVWAELCEHLKVSNAVQQHVRDHVPDYVAHRTSWVDGELWVNERFGFRPLRRSRVRLYVDPGSGLLRRNPHRAARGAAWRQRAAAERAALAARMRVLGPLRQLHLLRDGAWWEVTLAPLPAAVEVGPAEPGCRRRQVPPQPIDVVLRAGLSALDPAVLYGRSDVHAVAVRQLSKKQIRAFALR